MPPGFQRVRFRVHPLSGRLASQHQSLSLPAQEVDGLHWIEEFPLFLLNKVKLDLLPPPPVRLSDSKGSGSRWKLSSPFRNLSYEFLPAIKLGKLLRFAF